MKTTLTLISACLLTAATLQAQNFEWARSIGGTTPDMGYAVTTDASGNVYTTGYYTGTVDFNPGPGTTELTSSGGSYDIFIQKMDASGNLLWARSFGGTGLDQGYSITTDASGNIYTTGFFSGFADFNPGPLTAYLSSAGISDIFVLKMDASGNYLWAVSFGGTGTDFGFGITTDGSGNIFTTGFFQGTADFYSGLGTANLTSAGLQDVFVQKMDASGTFQWARSFGGAEAEQSYSISTDASGNVYTTGFFSGTVDFDPGSGTAALTSAGSTDIFVQKLDEAGNLLWARSFGQATDDSGLSVSVDASGNLYTTGYFQGTVDFDPDPLANTDLTAAYYDVFVLKMDASGNFLWAKAFGGTATDIGQSLSLDADGNVYTAGYFSGTVDFDPDASATATLTSAGGDDVYVQKLDASGNLLWATSFGGATSEEVRCISVDASGNIYTTGRFDGTTDFDPDLSGTANLISNGDIDIFVQKMSQSTPVGIEEAGNSIKVSVYPNPSTGTFHVAFDQAVNNVELVCTDLQGRVIFKQNKSTLLNTTIQLPYPGGIYYLTVKNPKGQSVIKMVKE